MYDPRPHIPPPPPDEPPTAEPRTPDADAGAAAADLAAETRAAMPPLDRIVDDLEPRLESGRWAREEMARGRTPEALATELVGAGWDEDDAALLVEEARRDTRHLRGVVTREDVARASAERYRQAMRLSWFAGFPMLASAWRLLISLGSLLRRPSRPQSPEPPSDQRDSPP